MKQKVEVTFNIPRALTPNGQETFRQKVEAFVKSILVGWFGTLYSADYMVDVQFVPHGETDATE